MQANYGYGAATLTASGFTFDANFCGFAAPENVNVYVNVYDYNTQAQHYHEVYYNYGTTTQTERWSKLGVSTTGKNGRNQLLGVDAARKASQVIPK